VRNRLQGESPMTLQQIVRRWGVSREWVRQVEVKSKQILRRHFETLESVRTRNAA